MSLCYSSVTPPPFSVNQKYLIYVAMIFTEPSAGFHTSTNYSQPATRDANPTSGSRFVVGIAQNAAVNTR